ncbi:hypothetical protein B0J15DRAFT_469741 [Fusarium solani]|uniref:Uncharacterized protein n=1 Tax=Fusarium solani TaxID=169388 RepID=A0A9P9K8G8_FUSSL|nr:uncharacterized protein B0J15DRAFT_469741 [Fusarium solani]KAH7243839.1 hypothetical protein B0J15DRAFT_469741 [Fusarium solani]
MEHHNIIITCLSTAQYGTNNAAILLIHPAHTFPSIRLGLMVEIGDAVPSKADKCLGDLIFGTRVMQYDPGKIVRNGQIQPMAIPKVPQQLLCTAVSALRLKHKVESNRDSSILQEIFKGHSEDSRPNSPDCLFDGCDYSKPVLRDRQTTDDPLIYYGAIAFGNQAMRCVTTRNKVPRRLDVLFRNGRRWPKTLPPCPPIWRMYGYSESHKNKEWQKNAVALLRLRMSSCIERSPAAIARLPQTQFNARTEIPKVYVLQYASQHVPYHTNATANTVPQGEFLSRFPVPSWISIINLFERYWAL